MDDDEPITAPRRPRPGDDMSDKTQVIGSEGLAVNLAGLAQQVGALEKIQGKEIEAVRREMEDAVESIRREIGVATSTLALTVTEKEQGIRRETLMATSTIKDELAAAIVAARDAAIADTDSSRKERQLEVERLEHLIGAARESSVADVQRTLSVSDERVERVTEMARVRYEDHKDQHRQEAEAIKLAVEALDKRLNALNELRAMVQDRDKTYAPLRMVEEMRSSLSDRVDREALDNRLRFERNDKESAERFNRLSGEIAASNQRLENLINAKFETSGEKWRSELRPVQDMKVSQGAIIAFIFGAIAIISIVIAIANFATQ